jgi:hypothetical protein
MPTITKFTAADLENKVLYIYDNGQVQLKWLMGDKAGQIIHTYNPRVPFDVPTKGAVASNKARRTKEAEELLVALDIPTDDARALYLAEQAIATVRGSERLKAFLELLAMFQKEEEVDTTPIYQVLLSDRAYVDYTNLMITQGYIREEWTQRSREDLPAANWDKLSAQFSPGLVGRVVQKTYVEGRAEGMKTEKLGEESAEEVTGDG